MRFGIGMNTDHTLEEVGQQFSVTRERIRQIEAKALAEAEASVAAVRKMRSFLGPVNDDAGDTAGADAGLPAAYKRFIEQFRQVDESVVAVLKGHLLIEEALDGIIGAFVFHAECLSGARLTFKQKLQIARAISLREESNSMWSIPVALNSLRNEFAHRLKSPRRAQKMKALLDAYRAETKGHPAAKHADLPEPAAIVAVCAFFLGFLTTFKEEVDRFKVIVTELDHVLNAPLDATANAR